MTELTNTTTSPLFARGAWDMRAMLLAIKDCNQEAIAKDGDLDVPALHQIVRDHINGGGEYHDGAMAALAEFLGQCMDGAVIDPPTWRPLGLAEPRASS